MEDWQLLREYVEKRLEPPFSKLVDRYLDVVYSSALRRLGSHQAAQDVTQSVFSLLAQKAPQIPPGTPLIGWLYRTVKFKALEYSRAEQRRQHYEKEAAAMMDPLPDQQEVWSDIVPHLEKAMDALPPDDQLALLLKYFQHQPFAVIGRTLKVSEDAARMRVNRALEKLRSLLAKQGITASAGTLATLLAENAVQSSPATLGPLVQSAALRALPRTNLPSFIGPIVMRMANATYQYIAAAILIVLLALIGGSFVLNRSLSGPALPGNSPERVLQNPSPSKTPWRAGRAAINPLPAADAQEEDLMREMRLMLYSPVEELVKGLDSAKSRDRAVFALGKLGPKAVSALPALKHCLERYDRDPQTTHVMGFEKDFIATAIKRIDPDSPKPLFTSNDLMPAMRTVSEYLAAHPVAGGEEWRREINVRMRKNFWSHAQIVEFAEQIGGVDSALCGQYVSKILKVDPTMEKVFNSKLRPAGE